MLTQWIMTSLPGSRTIHQIWWLEVFLDCRLQYESLEVLMDFLAFLVQKLWPNFRILIREIPWNYSAMSSTIWGLLAPTWAPETLGSRSRLLKLHVPAWNTTKLWAKILALCGGDDVTMKQPKKAKTTLFLTPPTENPEPKSKMFFFQCKLEDFPEVVALRWSRPSQSGPKPN